MAAPEGAGKAHAVVLIPEAVLAPGQPRVSILVDRAVLILDALVDEAASLTDTQTHTHAHTRTDTDRHTDRQTKMQV
jgi:hypothetical protein